MSDSVDTSDADALTFRVEGILDGRKVAATWENGQVSGDSALLAAAELIIASAACTEHLGQIVFASFDTLQGAVVALTRACKVSAVELRVLSAPPTPELP